jgi:hypothetical protein
VEEEGEEAEVDMLHICVHTIFGWGRVSHIFRADIDIDIDGETLLQCVVEKQQVVRIETGLVLGSEL